MLVSEAQIQPTHKSMRLDMGKEGVVVIYAFSIPFTNDDDLLCLERKHQH